MSELPVYCSVESTKEPLFLSVRIQLRCEAILFAEITVQDVRLRAGGEWIKPKCPQIGKREFIIEPETIHFKACLEHRDCPGGLGVGDLVFLTVEIGDGIQPFLFRCDHYLRQAFSEVKRGSEGWDIPIDAWMSDVSFQRGLFDDIEIPANHISEQALYGFTLGGIFDTLHFRENAFRIIGAEPTDNKQALIRASENTHAYPHHECVRARNTLLHPLRRTKAEIGWIPGLSGKESAGFSDVDISELAKSPSFSGSSPIYQANAWALVLLQLPEIYHDGTIPDETWLELMEMLADAVENVDDDEVLECINRDRETAGIARLESTEELSDELRGLYRAHATGIVNAIKRTCPNQGVDLVRYLVYSFTDNGNQYPGTFIQHIVDAYETAVSARIAGCASRIDDAIRLAKDSLGSGFFARGLIQLPVISRELVDWRKFSEPMLLIGQATGSSPSDAVSLLQKVRTFSIDLYNDHKLLDASCYLTSEILKHFSGLSSKLEKVRNDDCQCLEMKIKRDEQQDGDMMWFVCFDSASAGGDPYKGDAFTIGKTLIGTNDDTIELDGVAWMTWGTRVGHSGQIEYRVRLGHQNYHFGFRCGDQDDFTQITSSLWSSCGPRLALRLLSQIRQGKRVAWGDSVTVGSHGLYFPFYEGAPENRKILVPWGKLFLRQLPGIKLEVSSTNGLYKAKIDPLKSRYSHLIEFLARAVMQIGMDSLAGLPAEKGAHFDNPPL